MFYLGGVSCYLVAHLNNYYEIVEVECNQIKFYGTADNVLNYMMNAGLSFSVEIKKSVKQCKLYKYSYRLSEVEYFDINPNHLSSDYKDYCNTDQYEIRDKNFCFIHKGNSDSVLSFLMKKSTKLF